MRKHVEVTALSQRDMRTEFGAESPSLPLNHEPRAKTMSPGSSGFLVKSTILTFRSNILLEIHHICSMRSGRNKCCSKMAQ